MAELRVKSTGTIKLFENDNTSSVTIASPASLGADRTVTLPDASVTLASGTMLATDGSGASLTALNASELGSGTVPTARLGSGTASSSTVLYGDQTYKAEPTGGKVLQVVSASVTGSSVTTTSTTWAGLVPELDITPSATSSKILVMWTDNNIYCDSTDTYSLTIMRDTSTNLGDATWGTILGYGENDLPSGAPSQCSCVVLDSPSTTSSVNYRVYGKTTNGTAVHVENISAAYITAMEIGA